MCIPHISARRQEVNPGWSDAMSLDPIYSSNEVKRQVMCKSLPIVTKPSLRATAREAVFCQEVL